ncbi:hypothetical protein [Xanthomonas sp. WHRI 7945]|nr:hypothetical protein [Xanthomonas campestris pv. campestris]
MKIMSMARKFHYLTNGTSVFLIFLLILGMGGCSGPVHPMENAKCSFTHFDVLKAVADNSEIRGYAKEHFAPPEVTFLWDGMPARIEACGVARGGMRIVRSSSPGFNQRNGFIAIEKMYYDGDAAFLEIGFPPTGKNGDVFLRKRAGKWVVVEKLLWES